MKTKIFVILFTSVLVITACAIQHKVADHERLIGHWILIETLNDPGDGSAKWKPQTKADAEYITFGAAGHITGNSIEGATDYNIIDSNHLTINIKDNTAPITYRYKTNNNTLELNPPCREACGMRYVKRKR
ncbi:hypothetical protein [Mucilaginibacter sp. PAMB04168]|uniref:hypothetical protein n=1 Tax=Mucilaginibacter sp. PAMB04168 TaxID=3138567 RepID=UPI0031F6B047